MGIVNALRFDAHSGAMVTDEESWHLRRRKTYFSVGLFELLPIPGHPGPVCAALGCAGDPNYHHEAVRRARAALGEARCETVEEAGRIVLKAMHETTRRIVDDRLRFLFGFATDDLNRGAFAVDGEMHEIKNAAVLKRAREIVEGKEKVAGRDLVPPNETCLMGSDPAGGFQMFCLKESDGVLSFNAGGFESLGPGRYAGGMRLGGGLGQRTLASRREGFGRKEGMRLLLDSVLDAGEHFGMVGGHLHILTVDDRLPPDSRIRHLPFDRAMLATETVRGCRGGYLPEPGALDLLEEIVFGKASLSALEGRLFEAASDAEHLDLYLRGYKIQA
ncbi:MAG: hypothetical protein ACYTHM_05795 [Planctomycetota bacterium]|jgi:hypothetical protein